MKTRIFKENTDIENNITLVTREINGSSVAGVTTLISDSTLTACTVTVVTTGSNTLANDVVNVVGSGADGLVGGYVCGIPIGIFAFADSLGSLTVASLTGDNQQGGGDQQGGYYDDTSNSDGDFVVLSDGSQIGESVIIDGDIIRNDGDLGGFGASSPSEIEGVNGGFVGGIEYSVDLESYYTGDFFDDVQVS